MRMVSKILTSLAAAAALAVAVSGSAGACPYHAVTASTAGPQSVAQVPVPTTPAPNPGNDG